MLSRGAFRSPRAPLVSVVLPAFNRLHFLRLAINSVLAQTFEDWQLFIADDGSGAATQAYLHALQDEHGVRVLRLSHSGNPAAVRNAALREATGEYVAFLDSDDLWTPEKLQVQIGAMRAQTDCAWSYTGFTLVDARGCPLPSPASHRFTPHSRTLDQLVRGEVLVVTPSVVVRRELLDKLGGFDDELLVGEDFEFWVRLASHSDAHFVAQHLVLVRRHAQHSFDDITCLESLMKVIDTVGRSGVAAHLGNALRRRRVNTSGQLARAHARRKNWRRVFATLTAHVRYSWRYPEWWRNAAISAARTFAPDAAMRLVSQCRRLGRGEAPP